MSFVIPARKMRISLSLSVKQFNMNRAPNALRYVASGSIREENYIKRVVVTLIARDADKE